jgi:protein-tyrosine phosphatase
MAEVVTRALLVDAGLDEQVQVDSCGTGGWHVGDAADPRTIRVLTDHGYDGRDHRAQQIDAGWFDRHDLLLVADHGHERELRALAPDEASDAKIRLLRSYDPDAVQAGALELDDPWYGGRSDFERCLNEVERACAGLVAALGQQV